MMKGRMMSEAFSQAIRVLLTTKAKAYPLQGNEEPLRGSHGFPVEMMKYSRFVHVPSWASLFCLFK
jgi:hypothetical protein